MANFKINNMGSNNNEPNIEEVKINQVEKYNEIPQQEQIPTYFENENINGIENSIPSNMVNLSDVRFSAREKLAGNLLPAFFVTLVTLLISYVFMAPSEIMYMKGVFQGKGLLIGISALLYLIGIVVIICISVGHTAYYMNLHNGEGKFSDLFTNINKAWGYFKITFLSGLKAFLWMLIPFAGIYFGPKAALSYSFAPYIYLENPTKGARECIEESKVKTMGYKGNLFVLYLTFFGWLFLSGIISGILMTSAFVLPISLKGNDFVNVVNNLNGLEMTQEAANNLVLKLMGEIMPVYMGTILFASLISLILLMPITSYISMAVTEYYYMATGRPLSTRNMSNQSTKEKVILMLVTAGMALILSVGTVFVTNGAINKIMKQIEGIGGTPAVETPIEDENVPNEDNALVDDIIIEDNTDTAPSTDNSQITTGDASLDITYNVPSGYKKSEDSTYATDTMKAQFFYNDNYNSIAVTEALNVDVDLKTVIDENYHTEVTEYTTKSGISGIFYKAKDYDFYYFAFKKDGNIYEVEGKIKADVIAFIDTIK